MYRDKKERDTDAKGLAQEKKGTCVLLRKCHNVCPIIQQVIFMNQATHEFSLTQNLQNVILISGFDISWYIMRDKFKKARQEAIISS